MHTLAQQELEASTTMVVGLALFLGARVCMQLLLTIRRPANRRQVGTVSQLIIYPVKSCLGIRVNSASIEESGLVCQGVLDRSFAVTSSTTGKVVSLKACPQLSRVQPLLDASSPTGIRLSSTKEAENFDRPAVTVGGRPSDVISFVMFGQTVHGRLCDADSIAWLRRVCGREDLQLVHCPQPDRPTIDELRECQQLGLTSSEFQGELPPSGDSRIAFANTAPLLLATEVALETINKRLAENGRPGVDWRNFRPNLVISGPTKDRQEETWTFLFLGECALAVLNPCTRCGITTVDYAASEAALRTDGEPLRTLGEYRKDGAFKKYSPVFGVNGFVERPGLVQVGCQVLA